MKNNKALIIVLLSISAILLVYFYTVNKNKKKFNWLENYYTEGKDPYGTTIIKDLLKTYNTDGKLIETDKKISSALPVTDTINNCNYLFIGNDLRMDSTDINSLLKFVERGNTAFISAKEIPFKLMSKIYKGECGEWQGYYNYEDTTVYMKFYDSTLNIKDGYKYSYSYKNELSEYNWHCVNGTYFCDSAEPFISLAYIDSNYTNYIEVPYGDGSFLLHTSPMVFSNIQMLSEKNLKYVSGIFSYLNTGAIYWDEYDKNFYSSSQSRFSESPLVYILSQPALRWAWYLLLLTILLYVIFHAKRKQRAIPVLEPNTNTSLEFVKTIGRLYHQQNDPKKICIHKMKLFLAFIRNRYFIQTNSIDNTLIQKISYKSEVPLKPIETIFSKYKVVEALEVLPEDTFIEFHQSLEYFYKNCK